VDEIRFPKRPDRHKTARKTGAEGLRAGSVRVVTYTRISTDETNQPYSLEAQSDHLSKFLALREGWVLTNHFTDQMSGAKLERPGLQRLLADVRAGLIDVVLVYRVDRLSRSLRHLQDLIEILEDNQVALVSSTEPFDTSNSMGRMILNILGVFAEFERSVLIDRIKAGNAAKARRGEWVGGGAPYGYRPAEGKTLEIVESEAEVVRNVYEMCLKENLGGIAIAVRLNNAGRRTRRGAHWSGAKILDMLRRPTYAGWITHHDQAFKGQHEAIVSQEVFDDVQVIMDEHGKSWQRRSQVAEYKLAGLMRCTMCGASMIGEKATGRNNSEYRYYVCSSRKRTAGTSCASRRINADRLEHTVLSSVVSVYRDSGLFAQAAQRALQQREVDLPAQRAQATRIEKDLAQVRSSLDRYLAAFEAGTMEAASVSARVLDLQEREEILTAQRAALRVVIDAPAPVIPSAEEVAGRADWIEQQLLTQTGPTLKALLRTLIDHVDIGADLTVVPYLRVPNLGAARLDQVALDEDDVKPASAVATVHTLSSRRVGAEVQLSDLVKEALGDMGVGGSLKEFRISDLVDHTLELHPHLNRESVRSMITKELINGAHPTLVRVRWGVVKLST
jgi:site-specific DNA recombinase